MFVCCSTITKYFDDIQHGKDIILFTICVHTVNDMNYRKYVFVVISPIMNICLKIALNIFFCFFFEIVRTRSCCKSHQYDMFFDLQDMLCTTVNKENMEILNMFIYIGFINRIYFTLSGRCMKQWYIYIVSIQYIDNLFGDTLTHIVLEYKRCTPLYHGHILVQTKACLRVPYIQPINYTRVENLYEMAFT